MDSVYHPQEVTEEMVEDWIEEAEGYTDEQTLQVGTTNHDVTKIEAEIGDFRMVSFDTVARKILEEAHDQHRQYMQPTVSDMEKIIDDE